MEKPSGGDQGAAWRDGFQRKYIRQLVAVLRQRRIKRATRGLARSRAVKLAADLSLAMTARGRTAWSRAILRKCFFRLSKSRCQRRSVVKSRMNFPRLVSANNTRTYKTTFSGKKSVRRLFGMPGNKEAQCTVASRIQTLRGLVPGNRGLDLPVFLKEAANYIEALKLQAKALQALADWYSKNCAHNFQV